MNGNVALIFALAMPLVAVLAAGSIELTQVVGDRRKTQDVADNAAIDGAQQLSVTSVGATDRATAFANTQLTDMSQYAKVTVTSTQVDKMTLKVAIDTHRMSFFGNLLPPGGFFTHAEATAIAESVVPLCVLSTGSAVVTGSVASDLHLTGSASMNAPACMVHSNHNLQTDPKASLSAQAIEAAGTSSGSQITPAANTGAKTINDPFNNLPLTAPTACVSGENNNFIQGNAQTLAAGLHCQAVVVQNGTTLTLGPGTHWFKANLTIDDASRIDGTQGVTLVFENTAQFVSSKPPKGQMVNLRGAKTGPLAGFVLATTRDYIGSFNFPTDNVSEITGTIYVPAGTFAVNGKSKSASSSPWTVVVAQGMTINESANVVVNSNYAASDVPVPIGVGTKVGATTLTQ